MLGVAQDEALAKALQTDLTSPRHRLSAVVLKFAHLRPASVHPSLYIDHSRPTLFLRLLHGFGAIDLADYRRTHLPAVELFQVTPIARVVIFEIAQMMPRRGAKRLRPFR